MTTLIAATGAYAFSRFIDQALADSAGLRTIRLGTDPVTWVKSHFCGLSSTTVTRVYMSSTTDEYGIDLTGFFKTIDKILEKRINAMNPSLVRQFALTVQVWVLRNKIISYFQHQVKTANPWLHGFFFGSSPLMWIFRKAMMHTISYADKTAKTYFLIDGSKNSVRFVAFLSLSLVAASFVPTIKFRYRDEEAKETFKDLWIGNIVLTSNRAISPRRIGILGTLTSGIGFRFPLWSHPTKVVIGVTQLAIAGAVAYGAYSLCPKFIETHKTALIAGAVFALV